MWTSCNIQSGSQWGNEHIFVAERETITTVEQYESNQLLEFCMIRSKHACAASEEQVCLHSVKCWGRQQDNGVFGGCLSLCKTLLRRSVQHDPTWGRGCSVVSCELNWIELKWTEMNWTVSCRLQVSTSRIWRRWWRHLSAHTVANRIYH